VCRQDVTTPADPYVSARAEAGGDESRAKAGREAKHDLGSPESPRRWSRHLSGSEGMAWPISTSHRPPRRGQCVSGQRVLVHQRDGGRCGGLVQAVDDERGGTMIRSEREPVGLRRRSRSSCSARCARSCACRWSRGLVASRCERRDRADARGEEAVEGGAVGGALIDVRAWQDTFVTVHVGAGEAGTRGSWMTWVGRCVWAEMRSPPTWSWSCRTSVRSAC
jgi:hypothetical protein